MVLIKETFERIGGKGKLFYLYLFKSCSESIKSMKLKGHYGLIHGLYLLLGALISSGILSYLSSFKAILHHISNRTVCNVKKQFEDNICKLKIATVI